ncbi:hypothetical protein [Pseudomonas sp.]|uniref:hypothetical protein n=1 Tax=Pseudomonas sp. TaxID=306 RepID=UPI0028B0BD22|nr:hypothetical protein [Pseudomonas sp.]
MIALKAKLLAKYRQYSVPYRFYLGAMITYLFALATYPYMGMSAISIGTTLAYMLIICGFIAWSIPFARWLHTAWDKPFAKTPIIIMHLLALLMSTACARFAVADTLGLPPQSFDLTVGFLALLFYIPSWLGVVAIFLGLAAFLILIFTVIGLLYEAVWKHISPFAALLGFQTEPKQSRIMVIFHSAGAFVISVFFATSYVYLTDNFSPAFKVMTKVIALRSDFHKAPNYPDVLAQEYVHPLENGFIAYAREQDDRSVIIGVRLQSSARRNVVLATIPSFKESIAAIGDAVKQTSAMNWLPTNAAPETKNNVVQP